MQEKTLGKFPWQRLVFVAAILICTVMAVRPGSIDPTGFINDKLKHVIVFFVLALMLDQLAFPTERFSWLKPLGLLAFGGLIEILQDHIGYRQGNAGDLADMLSNLVGICGYFVLAAIIRKAYTVKQASVSEVSSA